MDGTYSMVFDTTLASTYNPAFVTANGGTVAAAEAALFAGMTAGLSYFNIHTSFRPGGEIRGFLAPVPAPATLVLLAIGLAGLGTAVRMRQSRPDVQRDAVPRDAVPLPGERIASSSTSF
jgi:hypothetical protein